MRLAFLTALAAVFCLPGSVSAGGTPSGGMEKRVLFGPESAPSWSVAEATLQAAPPPGAATPALRWHVPVDYSTGEKNYPIGWPRISHTLQDPMARDWSAWDFLHFRVYVETSRATLPKTPAVLILHAPDKAAGFSRVLSELKKGAWGEINLPVAQIPRPGDVRLIQFSLSESDYRDGDRVDFYIDDLALLRYQQPTVTQLAPENNVLFADARSLPVRFSLAGVAPGSTVPLGCELCRGARAVARVSVAAGRGEGRVVLPLGPRGLSPGVYRLVVRLAGGPPATLAPLRVVESPFIAR